MVCKKNDFELKLHTLNDIKGKIMLNSLLDSLVDNKSFIDLIKENKDSKQGSKHGMDTLYSLIQHENYVGEVINLDYNEAIIQVNDYFKHQVGGIASQTFLVATRINPNKPCALDLHGTNLEQEHEKEDCNVVLLRVTNTAELPIDAEKMRLKIDLAQDSDVGLGHWEHTVDPTVKRVLAFSGLRCRVIGTFYVENIDANLELCFGSDLSNFYSNRGLKVFKPTGNALENIVNFGLQKNKTIKIGTVRYSSTQRKNQKNNSVEVRINPDDLVAQKTAVFGMTRTGKSNTVKTIIKAIYQMRFLMFKPKKIGQIIFDPNGEYANENLQDMDEDTGQAQAIKNLWKIPVNQKLGEQSDVKIYALSESENNPNINIMKINFFDDKLIQIGKDLIDQKIETDGANISSHYIRNFLNLSFESQQEDDIGGKKRYARRLLVYKTLLYKAGFNPPKTKKVGPFDLFGDKLLQSMHTVDDEAAGVEDGMGTNGSDNGNKKEKPVKSLEKMQLYKNAAEILGRLKTQEVTYDELILAFDGLNDYISDQESGFKVFDQYYIQNSESKSSWVDNDLAVLLYMFKQANASRQIAKAKVFHNPKGSTGDYADMIYKDLEHGRLVVVDQSLGESQINKIAANRIMQKIFTENSKKFADAKQPSDILIFIEEAHNLMPKGTEEDTTNIWARVAKEGAKFKIGMIYSTQEVSSIQKNILKNTTNWFVSHLNNRDEVRALEDYYDFKDFSNSILYSEDKGFIRMKTKSNKFIVPVQIEKFQVR